MSYPKITQFFQPGDRIFWDDGAHKYEYEVADPPHTKYKKVRVVEVNDPRRRIRTAWWAPNRLPSQARWETALGHRAIQASADPVPNTAPTFPMTVRGALLSTNGGAIVAITQPVTLTSAGDTVTITTSFSTPF